MLYKLRRIQESAAEEEPIRATFSNRFNEGNAGQICVWCDIVEIQRGEGRPQRFGNNSYR
jgi:hypothetical protein